MVQRAQSIEEIRRNAMLESGAISQNGTRSWPNLGFDYGQGANTIFDNGSVVPNNSSLQIFDAGPNGLRGNDLNQATIDLNRMRRDRLNSLEGDAVFSRLSQTSTLPRPAVQQESPISLSGFGGGGTGSHVAQALQQIESARQNALQERASLDAQFKQRLNELRGQFQFAETAEEQRLLAQSLANIEAQRDAASAAIGNTYQNTIDAVRERTALMAESQAAEQAAVRGLYDRAGETVARTGERLNQSYDDAGQGALGVGADGGPEGMDDWLAMLASRGATEEALPSRLGGIATEGARWMESSLGEQRDAQQGALERLALSTSAQAEREQQQRVNDRIAQERMMFADAMRQTQGMFDQRGWNLGDQSRELQNMQAQLRFSAGESAAQRSQQGAIARAQMEAQMRNDAFNRRQNLDERGINAVMEINKEAQSLGVPAARKLYNAYKAAGWLPSNYSFDFIESQLEAQNQINELAPKTG
jgi:hypothetical protein